MRILIDGREFVTGRRTGIGRFTEGLTYALAQDSDVEEIIIAVTDKKAVPSLLFDMKKIRFQIISGFLLKSEKALSDMSKSVSLYISPYPKLPLFGTFCKAVNTVHDILYITHQAYRNNIKNNIDVFRLKRALKRASLTWYVSRASLRECRKFTGFTGANPKVRLNAIDEIFSSSEKNEDINNLAKYQLNKGYILVLGNGLPHKNIGILLEIASCLKRLVVFVGIPEKNYIYWNFDDKSRSYKLLEYVPENHLVSLIRGAFCLAHPSTVEGYGYPPLEAMSCGVPAVVSNIPVLVETTGNNAITIDPYSPEKWIYAFELLEDKIIYNSYVRKGLEWSNRFQGTSGWSNHIADIHELFDKLD